MTWKPLDYYISSCFLFSGRYKDTLYWSSGPGGERYLPKRDCQRKVRSLWNHPCGQPDFPKQGHKRKPQSKMEWSLWGITNKNTLLCVLWICLLKFLCVKEDTLGTFPGASWCLALKAQSSVTNQKFPIEVYIYFFFWSRLSISNSEKQSSL